MLIGWAANTVRQKWGLEIEQRHRDALQSAVMSGARAIVARNLGGQVAVEAVVAYARESVPDAIRRLGASGAVLEQMARGRIAEAAAGLR